MAKEIKGGSVKVQGLLNELFMPHSVLRAVQEIKNLRVQQHVSDTDISHPHQATMSIFPQLFLPDALLGLSSCKWSTPKIQRIKMRLPGTFNIINNDLPTAQFLLDYQVLRQRQQARNGGALTSAKAKNATQNNNKGDIKVVIDAKVANGDHGDHVKWDGTFTPAQDLTLIELKLKDSMWKAIATELGKEVSQVKERFKEIKPNDFDKRYQELKRAAKAEKQQQGGGPVADANKDNQKDEQNQQHQAGGNKGKKNKGKAVVLAPQEEEAEEADENGEWWEQSDGNWSKDDLEALTGIANEELRDAFVQIAARMATEYGKEVHPASVAEKILSSRPQWM